MNNRNVVQRHNSAKQQQQQQHNAQKFEFAQLQCKISVYSVPANTFYQHFINIHSNNSERHKVCARKYFTFIFCFSLAHTTLSNIIYLTASVSHRLMLLFYLLHPKFLFSFSSLESCAGFFYCYFTIIAMD